MENVRFAAINDIICRLKLLVAQRTLKLVDKGAFLRNKRLACIFKAPGSHSSQTSDQSGSAIIVNHLREHALNTTFLSLCFLLVGHIFQIRFDVLLVSKVEGSKEAQCEGKAQEQKVAPDDEDQDGVTLCHRRQIRLPRLEDTLLHIISVDERIAIDDPACL